MVHYVFKALYELSYSCAFKIYHFGMYAHFYSHRSDFLETEYLNDVNAAF